MGTLTLWLFRETIILIVHLGFKMSGEPIGLWISDRLYFAVPCPIDSMIGDCSSKQYRARHPSYLRGTPPQPHV